MIITKVELLNPKDKHQSIIRVYLGLKDWAHVFQFYSRETTVTNLPIEGLLLYSSQILTYKKRMIIRNDNGTNKIILTESVLF